MLNIDGFGDISYKPELLTIVEYIARGNCYRAKPFQGSKLPDDHYYLQQIGGTAPFNNPDIKPLYGPIPSSISKNMDNTAQVTPIYSPMTAVMALIPVTSVSNPVDGMMGFIIGEISTPVFYTTQSKKEHNDDSPFPAEDVFSIINDTNQVSTLYDLRANLDETVLPGDTVVKGKHTTFTIDNTSVLIGTDLANTYYSSITGECIDSYMLKQEHSIWHSDDTYVVKDSILNVKQYADNPYTAGLDCINNSEYVYTHTEVFGKVVNGKYYTVSMPTEKKLYQVFQQHIGNTGKYSLKAATGLSLGKSMHMDYIKCSGSHFKPDIDDTFAYIKPEFTDTVYLRATENEAYAKDYNKRREFSVDGTPVELYDCESNILFEDDGSVKITDAWGSYILLAHGNIQIHAANNLFIVTDRDAIHITGGVESHRAGMDIQMESVSSDIRMHAKNILQLGGTTINTVAKNNVCTADTVTIVTPDYSCLSNTNVSSIRIGGSLDNTYNNSMVYINSKETTITADKTIVMATKNSAVALDSKCLAVNTTLAVSRDITLDALTTVVQVDNMDYARISNSGSGSVKITDGSLYVNGRVESTGGIMSGDIIATSIAAARSNDGKLSKVRNLNLSSITTRMNTPITSDIQISVNNSVSLQPVDFDQNYSVFKFNKESMACTYRMDKTEIMTGKTYSITQDPLKGQSLYIYPGKSFWESTGLEIFEITDEGIITTSDGFNKYQFNQPNMITTN